MANRLGKESSPYLLQHRDNPVEWYPWGAEAIARARTEDKPILLSIGYSACHWCHVMAHESFENPDTARLMNENFVNIKVDREERPDLDQIYQNVAQVLTRSGGWPLTVFLTPDLEPFFGGTYYPPEDRYGRPGFPRVLRALSDAYRNDRESVRENARKIMEVIRSLESVTLQSPFGASVKDGLGVVTQDALKDISGELLRWMDGKNGGLSGAPKFPNSMLLTFLWRMGRYGGFQQGQEIVARTLVRMAQGGIYDQLRGGFHRYSVDDHWGVPHFEKMLYDNGLLLKLYAEAVLSTCSKEHVFTPVELELLLDVLSDTAEYLVEEMRLLPEGAFYSAQDADSEGEEGKYFVWSPDELRALLTPEEYELFGKRYGVTEQGNFEHGRTVLYQAMDIAEIARVQERTAESVREVLAVARGKVLSARRKRVAPGTDTKILTGWNGLAISGLAWAGMALTAFGREQSAEKALSAAKQAFSFLREKMAYGEDRLRSHYYRSAGASGAPEGNAFLDDYPFMSMAALDLARVTSDPLEIAYYASDAQRWMRAVMRHFSDPDSKGYHFTSDDHERLIQRPKSIYDQAIPSGTAVALECMAVLSELNLGESASEFTRELEAQLPALFSGISKSPTGYGELLSACLLVAHGPVVVSGPGADQLCRHPHVFHSGHSGQSEQVGQLAKRPGKGGELLICHRQTCVSAATLEEARGIIGTSTSA